MIGRLLRKIFGPKRPQVQPGTPEAELVAWLQSVQERVEALPYEPNPDAEELVQIHIPLTPPFGHRIEWNQCLDLELALRVKVPPELGLVDGNEIGDGTYTIWLYAVKADALTAWLLKELEAYSLPSNTRIFARHGDVDDSNAREEEIVVRP